MSKLTGASDIWSEDLTDPQLKMVAASSDKGFGVDLRGPGDWRVARRLQLLGLGHIEGGAPNGSELPGLYFNDTEGERVCNEFADDPDDDYRCPICGGDPCDEGI